MLSRRRTLALLVTALALPSVAGAALPPPDAATVERIQRHLSSITTLQARFEQLNPDGSVEVTVQEEDKETGRKVHKTYRAESLEEFKRKYPEIGRASCRERV